MASRRAPTDAHSGAGDAADPFPRLSSHPESREVAGLPPEAQGQAPSRCTMLDAAATISAHSALLSVSVVESHGANMPTLFLCGQAHATQPFAYAHMTPVCDAAGHVI